MRITPLDIRHKEFTRALRGYKDEEVDEFLDEINEEFERLFNENVDYKEKLTSLEEKIREYQDVENTLHKALISAQQRAEELKQNAQKEADLILRDAEHKSHSIVNESYVERQRVQREVQSLQKKHDDLRYQLGKIIETFANSIRDHEVVLTASEPQQSESLRDSVAPGEGHEMVVSEAPSLQKEADKPRDEEPVGASENAKKERVPEDSEKDRLAETSLPWLKPGANGDKSEDPFADVEIDIDEDIFKW